MKIENVLLPAAISCPLVLSIANWISAPAAGNLRHVAASLGAAMGIAQ